MGSGMSIDLLSKEKEMGSLLDLAPLFLLAPRSWLATFAWNTRTLSHLTARGNDQQTIVHDETDRTDFLTRLGQEIPPQQWGSAQSSNDPTRVSEAVPSIAMLARSIHETSAASADTRL